MPEMNIRQSWPDDAARLAALIQESFRDVAGRFGLTEDNAPTHPANCRPEWIETAMAKGVRYFVLERGGEPIGCVALERAGREAGAFAKALGTRREPAPGGGVRAAASSLPAGSALAPPPP
ncbi:MAG: hypothetical protein KJ621_19590, partial [Proteobacteria bacterium]|nr:hypothetical protein [Pseudomonadota bacterium]